MLSAQFRLCRVGHPRKQVWHLTECRQHKTSCVGRIFKITPKLLQCTPTCKHTGIAPACSAFMLSAQFPLHRVGHPRKQVWHLTECRQHKTSCVGRIFKITPKLLQCTPTCKHTGIAPACSAFMLSAQFPLHRVGHPRKQVWHLTECRQHKTSCVGRIFKITPKLLQCTPTCKHTGIAPACSAFMLSAQFPLHRVGHPRKQVWHLTECRQHKTSCVGRIFKITPKLLQCTPTCKHTGIAPACSAFMLSAQFPLHRVGHPRKQVWHLTECRQHKTSCVGRIFKITPKLRQCTQTCKHTGIAPACSAFMLSAQFRLHRVGHPRKQVWHLTECRQHKTSCVGRIFKITPKL